jgi:hypothetical protein
VDARRRTPPALDLIREHAQARADALSVRRLAAEIGMGASTLQNFLAGSLPHKRIASRLEEWYASRPGAEAPQAFGVSEALDMLGAGLPPSLRPVAQHVLYGAVAGLYRSAGLSPPTWTGAE